MDLVHRIADLQLFEARHEELLERVGYLRKDDEALGRNAALAGVYHPGGHGGPGRLFDVRVVEDDEGVGTAQFEDDLLDPSPCRLAHLCALPSRFPSG